MRVRLAWATWGDLVSKKNEKEEEEEDIWGALWLYKNPVLAT